MSKIKDFLNFIKYKYESLDKNSVPFNETKILSFYSKIYKSKNILIIGDYDVDGMTSTAMMADFIKLFKSKKDKNITTYIPSRYDGYSVDFNFLKAYEEDFDMFVLLDNGTDKKLIDKIDNSSLKDKIFIIDHHPNDEIKPHPYLINPAIDYDKNYSTSTGLIVNSLYMQTFSYLKSRNILKDYAEKFRYIKLASLSAIADMASLNNKYNRSVILKGFEEMKLSEEFLFKTLNHNDIHQELSFKVIPLLNSLGRLGTTKDINEFDFQSLFFEIEDEKKFKKAYNQLKELNEFRKKATSFFYNDALKQYKTKKPDVFVYFNEHTPIGINGNIAQKFHQNGIRAIALSPNPLDTELIVGSARGKNLKTLIQKFKEDTGIEIEFGGHEEAFGLKLKREHLDKFLKTISEYKFDLPNDEIDIYPESFELDEYFNIAKSLKEEYMLPLGDLPKLHITYDKYNLFTEKNFGDYCLAVYKDHKFLTTKEIFNQMIEQDSIIANVSFSENNFNLYTLDTSKIPSENLEPQKKTSVKP